MKKMMICVVAACCMMIPAVVLAEDGFKVAGEVTFEKSGNIYLQIVTKDQFENDTGSEFSMILQIDEDAKKANTIAFEFENVPAGTYAITAFQDENGNGEMDMGTFGPKEPWGTYKHDRPKFSGPKFEKMAFEVKADVTEIALEMK